MAPLRLSGRELAAFAAARAATTAVIYSDAEEDEGEDGEVAETTEEEAERILKAPSPLTCFQRSAAGKAVAKGAAGDVHTTTYMKVCCLLARSRARSLACAAHPRSFLLGPF
jgi:hypothetical protein